ncbi:MAG: hypothetical protein H6819_01940 [Phycisphaerales bacterium]|nr:hypothetical protein [Phycisphaerales bacterium]MCB9857028.1 hypothetical protein [Phycisphaerales bacterium]MCB9861845.1 hypothetical protein [Phycisphaerales bacterium]
MKDRFSSILVVMILATFIWTASRPTVSAEDEPSSRPAAVASEPDSTGGDEITIPGMQLDEADAMLMTHYARRAIRAGFKGTAEGGEPYVPPSLEGKTGVVYVTLWRGGVEMAAANSDEMPVISATMAAAAAAGKALKSDHLNDPTGCEDCGLEIEWMGPDEPISPPYFREGTTYTADLLGAIDPGVNGVAVSFDGKKGRTPASEIIQRHYSPDVAIIAAEGKIGLSLEDKLLHPEKVSYFRNDSLHLWQPDAKAKPERLIRGELLVRPDAVTPDNVDAAIKRTGDYLLYRQNSNGAFSHEYVPSADRYLNKSDALVQLRSLYGMSRLAAYRKDAKSEQGAANGIAAFSRYLEDLNFQISTQEGAKVAPGGGRILYIPGHENHLESTAYLMLSMASVPDHATYEPEMRGLTKTLLYAQLSDGSMRLILGKAPEGPPTAKEDRAGATALAALAQRYALTKDANIDTVMLETLGYYTSRANDLSADASAWLIRAYAQQYTQTGQPRYEAFVFMMADRFASLQLTPESSPSPELWGAIAPSKSISAEAKTALYVSALSDALRVARRTGDTERVRVYEQAVSLGTRFIMQLEFSETGAYYVRSKLDVVGGIRSKPWDANLRADLCAFGVVTLIDARTSLFRK